MGSSKIQEYNLDPNMGLAKESSVQEVLNAISNVENNVIGSTTQQFIHVVESDNVKHVLLNTEVVSNAGSNTTIATIYCRNMYGTIKLSGNLKTSSGATGGAIISYTTYGENENGTSNQYDAATSDGVTTYTTKTLTIRITPDIYKIWVYLHGNNVNESNKYYCNYATLSYDIAEIKNSNIVVI